MVDKPQIDKVVDAFGQEGLRFLCLFKLIKEQVQQELKREKRTCPNEDVLNVQCAKITKELMMTSKKTPTNEEIKQKVEILKIAFSKLDR